MPALSRLEHAFCRSWPWRFFARRIILPWALQGATLSGEALEVGTGSGATAAELLDTFPALRLVATDVDERMLEEARQRLTRFGRHAEVRMADATALPFEDDRFDAVISFLTLHHVGEWERALEEFTRVTRPGGWLFIYDLLDSAPNRLFHAMSRSPGVRVVSRAGLGSTLRRLPLVDVKLKSSVGIVFRLAARKAA